MAVWIGILGFVYWVLTIASWIGILGFVPWAGRIPGICGLLLFCIVMDLRRKIREKNGIPETCCEGCEDCCCSWWCWPCVVCQMARHEFTGPDKTYQCCHPTGGVQIV